MKVKTFDCPLPELQDDFKYNMISAPTLNNEDLLQTEIRNN